MEAPQMRGVEEPLLPEPRAVEGGATQSEGAIETQEARYPRLHKTAGLRSLDVWVEISRSLRVQSAYDPRDSGRPVGAVHRGVAYRQRIQSICNCFRVCQNRYKREIK